LSFSPAETPLSFSSCNKTATLPPPPDFYCHEICCFRPEPSPCFFRWNLLLSLCQARISLEDETVEFIDFPRRGNRILMIPLPMCRFSHRSSQVEIVRICCSYCDSRHLIEEDSCSVANPPGAPRGHNVLPSLLPSMGRRPSTCFLPRHPNRILPLRRARMTDRVFISWIFLFLIRDL